MIVRRPHEAPPKPQSPLSEALGTLAIGGFLFMPESERPARSTAAMAYNCAKRLGRKFTCRAMQYEGHDGIGIWRLADPREVEEEWELAITREAAGLAVPTRVGRPELRLAGHG